MAGKLKPTTSAEGVDLTPNVRTLKKWLKSLKVKTELMLPVKDISPGLRHGILFLDYLRCQNYPQAVTGVERNLLNVMAELHVKPDPEGASSSGEPADQKSKRTAPNKGNFKGKADMENQEEQKPNKKVAGPRKGAIKLIPPLADAMNKLNIQDNKGCGCKGNCRTKNCGCQKKNVHCNASCKCSHGCVNKTEEVKNEGDTEETGNGKKTEETGNEKETNEDSSDNESSAESGADESSSEAEETEEFQWMRETVNWNKHIASLVKCPKCQRNFVPSRVDFHAKVCRNV